MDGLEVCQRLKEEPATQDIPIIFLSARVEVQDRIKGLDLGAVDYVTKPFDMDEVASRIRAALRTRMKTMETAQQLEGMKKEFLSLLAHEMASPLTAIRGFAELLEMGLSNMDARAQMECLKEINRSSRVMSGTLDDFLSLAQEPQQAGRPLEVNPAVREAVEELAAEREKRKLTLHLELPEVSPQVKAHPRFLTRGIFQLLSNAQKFSADGGEIWLKVHNNGDSVLIEVRDQGIGIAPDNQEKIFEKFYQVDPSRTRSFSGMGIGLAVARRVARGLGGEVTVESALGKGATFVMRLPTP